VARLRGIPEYVQLFRAAFPGEFADSSATAAIDVARYARAVAAYERELVTRNSAFDRWLAGDDSALSATQLRGLALFFDEANCSSCHVGPLLSDFQFHVIGVPQAGPGKAILPGDDTGREEHTGDPADRHAFRTPGLRNVELTAPYMHDGAFATLEEVVDFYDEGGQPRHATVDAAAVEDELGGPLGLTDAEVAAIVDFMESLTDSGTRLDPQLLGVPTRVPSGLTPGGSGPVAGR
jgi:cytochrome c peroxidase